MCACGREDGEEEDAEALDAEEALRLTREEEARDGEAWNPRDGPHARITPD